MIVLVYDGCLPDTTAVLKDRENMLGDLPFAFLQRDGGRLLGRQEGDD